MAVAFARVLRGAGLAVPTSTVLRLRRGARRCSALDRRDDVYWAGRATLVRRPEDVAAVRPGLPRVLGARRAARRRRSTSRSRCTVTLAVDDGEGDDAADEQAAPSDDPTIELRFSATEVLRHKDFADYDDDELAEAHRLMGRLRLRRVAARARCGCEPASRRTARPDLRRTVRAALRTEGEPMRRHFRDPATRFRRLVLLLDVSGSMEPYARALLRFVQAAVAGRRRVEAFALGTRLDPAHPRARPPATPTGRCARRPTGSLDWSGGTRLGDGLRRFNDEWGVRGMARGAVVVILSDGWDRGDPDGAGRADAAPRAASPTGSSGSTR